MKYCELCKGLARTYCESDQASLCWNCDSKVHGANFLVARHSRTVLCHACQSPTPWKASGAELGITVSVCESCVVGVRNRGEEEENQGGDDDEIDTDDDDLDEDDDHGDDDDDDEEDGDNQVVPWSATSTTPPPAASSSSSADSNSGFSNGGGEVSEAETMFSLKPMREIAPDPSSQKHIDCSPPKRTYHSTMAAPAGWSGADGEDPSVELRPLKNLRTESERPSQAQTGSCSTSFVGSLRKFRRQYSRNLS